MTKLYENEGEKGGLTERYKRKSDPNSFSFKENLENLRLSD